MVRNYKKEYRNYQGKPKQIKMRAMRNSARRSMGLKVGNPRVVDHKVPLSRGGGNGHGNMRIVSRSTNLRKYNKLGG